MTGELLIVNKKLLPKCYEKVVMAKELLESSQAINVKDACEKVGISRATFYKYQEYVFLYKEGKQIHSLVISFTLSHKTGALSRVCDLLSKEGVSIITISQSSPIKDRAAIMLSLDISNVTKNLDELKDSISQIEDIKQLKVMAVE